MIQMQDQVEKVCPGVGGYEKWFPCSGPGKEIALWVENLCAMAVRIKSENKSKVNSKYLGIGY